MSTALDHIRPVSAPARIGQATAVEQSRAIAEVQAQVVVAQQMPRDVDRACREMIRSCGRKALAEKAFYRFPRAGGQVSGESITLATELARCWGNIDYGIAELRRDDDAAQSEMLAYAWDLETNTRPRTTFIVPHVRDTQGGGKRLTDARDVYENNANMGSRRVREMIFRVLPPWFIEDAKAACYATLAADKSDGETLAERASAAVKRFGDMGVRPEQLVQKLGAPQDKWSATDLATLGVIYRSLQRGESTKEEEFGAATAPVTAADITGQDAQPPAARQRRTRRAAKDPLPAGTQEDSPSPAPPQPAPAPPAGQPAGEAPAGTPTGAAPAAVSDSTGGHAPETTAQPDDDSPTGEKHRGLVAAVQQHFRRIGYGDGTREERLADAARIVQTTGLLTLNDLDNEELSIVADTLAKLPNGEAGKAKLKALLETGEVPDGQ